MTALAKVFVTVEPQTDRFEPDLKKRLARVDASKDGGRVGKSFGSGFSKSLTGLGDRLSGLFKSGFGKAAAVAGGASVALAFGSAFAGGLDVQDAQAKLTAQLGLSGSEAAKAGKVAGNLFKGAYGDSLGEVNDAVRKVVQDTGTALNSVDLQPLTGKVLSVSKVFDQDLGGVTRAVGQLMRNGLAKNATEALDIVAKGFQSGADKSEDFLDTLNEYGTQFRKLGLSGAQATGLISQGLKAGARDGDTVADAIKEFAIRAVDGSKSTTAGFKAIGLSAGTMAKDIGKGGTSANKALDLTLDRLRKIPDPVKRSQAAVALFGTKAEDLGDALFSLDPSSAVAALGKVGGAAAQLDKTVGGTASQALTKFKRTVQTQLVAGVGGAIAAFQNGFSGDISSDKGILGFVARVGDKAGALVAFIKATVIPGLKAFVASFQDPDVSSDGFVGQMEQLGVIARQVFDYIQGTAVPALADFGRWVVRNQGWLVPLAAGIGAIVVAIKVWTVVTRTFAVVQAALNVVLALNPIGIVVLALVGLATALVVAYKRSETFRNIVNGAFGAVKAVVVGVYDWIKGHWPLILGILTGPIGAAVIVIVRNWDKIKSTAAVLWEAIKTTFRTGAAYAVDKFLSLVGAVIHGAAKAFGWVPGLGGKLKDAAKAFDKFRDDVNRALSGVKSRNITVTAKASVLMSQGLSRSDAIATTLHRAAGGPIFGPGTGTSDSIPAMLSNGEHVLTAREVKAFGGHDAVMQMRQAAVQGFAAGGPVGFDISPRLTGMAQFSEQLERFNNRVDAIAAKLAIAASTGPTSPGLNGAVSFARSQAGKPYVWGAAGPGGYDCSGFISALVNVVQGRRPYSRRFSTGTLPAGLFAPGKGAFNIGWFRGNPGHVAATVNGVPMESRGGDGVVVGSRSRGAGYSFFTHHGHLKGFAQGGPVLPGDPPFDVLDPRGRHYKPGLLAALQNVRTYDSGGDMPPGIGVWRNNTGRTETVTTAHTMDAVVGELKALRAAWENLPIAQVDDRVIKRAANYQNIRNRSGY